MGSHPAGAQQVSEEDLNIEESDDGFVDDAPLGVKDLAVLAAVAKLPELGHAPSVANIMRYTTLDKKEVVDIVTFLLEHGFINSSSDLN